MSRSLPTRTIRLAVVTALVFVLAAGLAGCGKSNSSSNSPSSSSASTQTTAPVAAVTAKQGLPLAVSALSTTMPEGKLLLVASSAVITPQAPPTWQYLFGSPKTNLTYVVVLKDGKASAIKYGKADLSASEWKAVPSTDAWKIDSDAALAKASAVYKNAKKDTAYILGFVSYVPKSAAKSKTPAMTWSVSFDPSTRGTAETSTVDVNIETGVAGFAKAK